MLDMKKTAIALLAAVGLLAACSPSPKKASEVLAVGNVRY